MTTARRGTSRLAPLPALAPAGSAACGAGRSPRPGRCRRRRGSRRPPPGCAGTPAVRRPAERPGAPVDRGPAVGGGDHVHQHPRPVRRAPVARHRRTAGRGRRRRPAPAAAAAQAGTVPAWHHTNMTGRRGARSGRRVGSDDVMTTLTDAPSGTGTSVSTRTAFRTCPLCEAGCGLEITLEERPRSPASGATATTCSATGSSARRARRSSSSTRTPTGSARRWSSGTASSCEATWDEAFAEVEQRLLPVYRRARPRRGGRLPRQPERPQPGRPALRPPADPGPRHPQRVLGQHGRPAAQGDRRRA